MEKFRGKQDRVFEITYLAKEERLSSSFFYINIIRTQSILNRIKNIVSMDINKSLEILKKYSRPDGCFSNEELEYWFVECEEQATDPELDLVHLTDTETEVPDDDVRVLYNTLYDIWNKYGLRFVCTDNIDFDIDSGYYWHYTEELDQEWIDELKFDTDENIDGWKSKYKYAAVWYYNYSYCAIVLIPGSLEGPEYEFVKELCDNIRADAIF